MVSINKSFLYGIGFASITWIISLYLYTQLIRSVGHTATKEVPLYSANLKSNLDSDGEFERNKKDPFKSYLKKNQNKGFNSDNLLNNLKPIQKNLPNKTNKFEQGMYYKKRTNNY